MQEKEVSLEAKPGPGWAGWAGLKGQAHSLGLNSRGTRELRMVSEAVSNWIELDTIRSSGHASEDKKG